MIKNKKGFTLIEVLIVVLIIGVLAGVALPQYRLAKDKAQYSTMMNIGRAIAEANERYWLANNKKYATNFDQLDINLPANRIEGGDAYFDWGKCILWSQQELQCTNYTSLKNQFILQYKHNAGNGGKDRIVCTAQGLKENSRYDRVCQSFGKFSRNCPGNCCHIFGECRIYIIRN